MDRYYSNNELNWGNFKCLKKIYNQNQSFMKIIMSIKQKLIICRSIQFF